MTTQKPHQTQVAKWKNEFLGTKWEVVIYEMADGTFTMVSKENGEIAENEKGFETLEVAKEYADV